MAFNHAIELDPEDRDHWSLLGAIEFDRRDWKKARSNSDNAFSLDPDSPILGLQLTDFGGRSSIRQFFISSCHGESGQSI